MLPDGRRIGAHLPLGHGLVRAADRAAAIGASAIQVFTDNPAAWRRRGQLPRELEAFRERLAFHDIAPISVHAPYLVNLAGPDPARAERSVELLAHELRVAAAYGAALLNLHVGSHHGDGVEAGATRIARGIRAALDRLDDAAADVTIVLENGAGGGFGMGATIDELAMVDEALGAGGVARSRIGFCLDTAHLWGAGHAIDTPAGVDELLGTFDTALGGERLRMVHLNDSRSEPGSRSDRHEHLGAGRIGTAGLRRILTHPALAHVVYILETPGMDEGYDAINLQRARDIAAGVPLADLPPAAFETRSAKSRSAPAEDADEADQAGPGATVVDAIGAGATEAGATAAGATVAGPGRGGAGPITGTGDGAAPGRG
jgi:deoxyribonuclease-4